MRIHAQCRSSACSIVGTAPRLPPRLRCVRAALGVHQDPPPFYLHESVRRHRAARPARVSPIRGTQPPPPSRRGPPHLLRATSARAHRVARRCHVRTGGVALQLPCRVCARRVCAGATRQRRRGWRPLDAAWLGALGMDVRQGGAGQAPRCCRMMILSLVCGLRGIEPRPGRVCQSKAGKGKRCRGELRTKTTKRKERERHTLIMPMPPLCSAQVDVNAQVASLGSALRSREQWC